MHSTHFQSYPGPSPVSFRAMGLKKTLPDWKDCFDYMIGVSEMFALPPFSSRTSRSRFKLGMFVELVMMLRLFMTLLYVKEGFLIGCLMFIYVLDTFIKLAHLSLTEGDFRDYFRDIDDFIREYELELSDEGRSFSGIWMKERPWKLFKITFGVAIGVALTWSFNTIYAAAASPEVPQPFYWSPFFEVSEIMKWIYTLLEFAASFPFTVFPWYLNMVFMSLVKFQHAQLIYAREMAGTVFRIGFEKQTRENVVFWVRIHQKVLRSKDKINDLLGIQALSTYFFLTLGAVFTIVISLFKNATHDNNQKLIAVIFLVLLVMQFSYNCILMDKWEDEEISIRETVFSEELFKADKWQVSAYNMYMNRLNKPLNFVGLHHVTMNSSTLRGMFTNIYSLYTSLVSVLRRRGT